MLMAVYGSLRKDMHNSHKLSTAQFLGVETIWGYDMYSLGSYPYIIKGEGKVTFEIYEVPEREAKAIARMELGAGYREEQLETEYGMATIYVMASEEHARYQRRGQVYSKVEHGDWCKERSKADAYNWFATTTSDESDPVFIQPNISAFSAWNLGTIEQLTDEEDN